MLERHVADTRLRHRLDAITRVLDGDVTTIIVVGELDIAMCPRLGVEINEAIRGAPRLLLIDLREVQFLDSTGLAVLLNARRSALRRDIALKLICDVPGTLQLFALTRLEADFDIHPTLESALAPTA